jgi:diacylglycerol kinase (ATP)
MTSDAEIDDGYMDIVVIRPLSRLELLNALPKIFKGTHVGILPARVIRAREVSIKT